jgi:hypothetical protein
MRVYALEEHMVTAAVTEAWRRRDPRLAEPRAYCGGAAPGAGRPAEPRIGGMAR